jgi:general secretion pathway protein B
MSFILDALKKSETERQQQTGAEFSSVPSSSDNPQSLKWLWILAALLAINVAALLGILLRSDAPSAPPATEAPAAALPAEAAATMPAGEPSFEEQLVAARERQADREQAAAAVRADAGREPAVTVAPSPPASSRRLSTIDEVRLGGELQVPELHLDIHVYSDVPEERFVFINMVKHRERSRLDEGPVVNEITPDGVILDFQGRTFLLPRE